MNIVFITSTLGYGGAAKMLAFVANNLAKNMKVHVLAYNSTEAVPVFDERIDLLLLGEKVRDKGHIGKIMALTKIIKDIKPKILVSFLTFPNMYSVIIGKLLHIPVIISERGNPFESTGIKMKVIYTIINSANGAVFQTDGAKSFFAKRLQKKSTIIPNPVVKRNQEVKYNIDCKNNEIVYVGRLENIQKRLDILIEAMDDVVNTFPDAKLLIYGDGEDEQKLKELASHSKCSENIFFKGRTSDPEMSMSNSEVYVLCSDYEGIPNSLIEAMSIGMPVISTDCDPGGARLLIQNNINGLLVPKGDSKALAKSIKLLLSNHEMRCSLSKKAKEININYSEKNIFDIWEKYILHIVQRY